ncbi:hypothetical protein LCGC14_0164830 [marine sediment metagenome]|uniref:Uncharacterized protein n=1 Tax=marine sediment metagenome TaxID=412755 RepID=A0A0F9UYP3_9ZZZZ
MGIRFEVTETKKSRMEPEYSLEALEKQIVQHYKNASVLEESAQTERKKARAMEKVLNTLRSERAGE